MELDALMSSSGVHDAMSEAAEMALDHAQGIAPVDTGEYRDSFRVEQSSGSDRAEARLVNDDEGAGGIEWGKGGSDGHHTLAQTADWLEGGGG